MERVGDDKRVRRQQRSLLGTRGVDFDGSLPPGNQQRFVDGRRDGFVVIALEDHDAAVVEFGLQVRGRANLAEGLAEALVREVAGEVVVHAGMFGGSGGCEGEEASDGHGRGTDEREGNVHGEKRRAVFLRRRRRDDMHCDGEGVFGGRVSMDVAQDGLAVGYGGLENGAGDGGSMGGWI